MAERILRGHIKEGDTVILDVNAEGKVTILNGDRSFISEIGNTPTGIS